MFNLKKIFSPKKPSRSTRSQGCAFPPELILESGSHKVTARDIDQSFSGYLLGVNSLIDTDLNPLEQEVIRQLDTLLQQDLQSSQLLPRLPRVLPKLMQVLRDEESTAKDIAALVEEDPVLVAELIRLVNSPYYRTSQKVLSLRQATVLLGREGMRKLVASAVVKPLLNVKQGHFMKLSSRTLWEHSEKTAIAASRFCSQDEESAFHAFLAGILQNIGLTVGLKIMDSVFDGSEAPNSILFHETFMAACRELSSEIVKTWTMPVSIYQAFTAPDKDDSSLDPYGLEISLFVSDRIAKAQILGKRISIDPGDVQFLLNREPCPACRASLDEICPT
ncbi:MAG: HDOD domain-containing protein [Sedimenticola sp.]